jgi:CO/xanthine dehydrogenase Mo-binding subunit
VAVERADADAGLAGHGFQRGGHALLGQQVAGGGQQAFPVAPGIGWGMAAGTYPLRRSAGEAMVRILADGDVEVASSTSDMGTGAYTILAQTAASVFGLPLSRVRVTLGDSTLPRAPVFGGSQMAGLMTGAVDKAAAPRGTN